MSNNLIYESVIICPECGAQTNKIMPTDNCQSFKILCGGTIAMKKSTTLLKTGIIGSVIAALCCFTPILVILLGVIGMSSAVGYLDFVLLPALGVFICITLYALVLKYKG
ncbi:mercury resistance system transport protein MerF [Neptunomonas qingdaonensis]|uniref:Membrane transport protein MerF n=2 Tax=Neptunomonas qingdaonensis TaxID=1045558 RepID=A0A1I2SHU8_9GAMM|nr:mercury resistance system transport protein MerF [Neptunomonas qingdaonensis]SFG52364.1 Membrane transport protein MerF [Neptunomonas qingdaonensis]